MNDAYTCEARVIFEGDQRNVTEVSQNHLTGKNNSDVKNLMIRNQVLGLVPRNIGDFFPNLEALDIVNAEITEISRGDFAGLPQLRQLDFFRNNISHLGSNLFEGSPLMEAFSLYYNPVSRVGYDAFKGLDQLTSLHFSVTKCINERADEDRVSVEELIFMLAVNCPPTLAMIEADVINGFEFKRTIDLQIADRVNPLTYHVFELEGILNSHEIRIAQIEQELIELKETTKQIKELIASKNTN